MREYETIFIVSPSAKGTDVERFNKRLEKIITEYHGTIIQQKDMGRKSLAYPVKKQTKGMYMYFDYAADGGAVSELERLLRLEENVLKYLTVKVADEVDIEARKKQVQEAGLKVEEFGATEQVPTTAAVEEEVEIKEGLEKEKIPEVEDA